MEDFFGGRGSMKKVLFFGGFQFNKFFKLLEIMRKHIRDTSIWRRAGALSCLERANSITNYRIGSFLIIAGTALSHSFGMSLILAGMAVLVDVIRARTDDGLVQRPLIVPKNVTFDTFAGAISREVLGFRHQDLRVLHAALNWPDEVLCVCGGEDRSKDYRVSGEQAFLFMLYRHHMPDNLTNLRTFLAGVMERHQ